VSGELSIQASQKRDNTFSQSRDARGSWRTPDENVALLTNISARTVIISHENNPLKKGVLTQIPLASATDENEMEKLVFSPLILTFSLRRRNSFCTFLVLWMIVRPILSLEL